MEPSRPPQVLEAGAPSTAPSVGRFFVSTPGEYHLTHGRCSTNTGTPCSDRERTAFSGSAAASLRQIGQVAHMRSPSIGRARRAARVWMLTVLASAGRQHLSRKSARNSC